MATFEEQTACVVEALFSDLLGEDESDYRSLETDSGGPVPSAGQPPTRFDPVVVASRLRQMGDQCNMDFERVSSEALTEVLMGKVKRAVSSPACSLSAGQPCAGEQQTPGEQHGLGRRSRE
ncbi:PREDICTED: bcl-2-like protein 15, partial [Chlamydotis macqueenii]|uniref:bcl-2-like protein 15 n=1 Tax=Chlamydotis macqueenii TaxID=187382 RepID=UPI000529CC8B